MRYALTANKQYYVSAGMSDNNDGLSPTTAWGTITHAYNFIRDEIDFSGKKVNVKVLDGSHGPATMTGNMTGMADDTDLVFTGNINSPQNVPISGVNANGITVNGGARVKLEGFMPVAVQAASFMSGGHGLVVYQDSRVTLGVMGWYNCDFSHIDVAEDAHVQAQGRQDLFGISPRFVLCEDYGKVWLNGQTITAAAPTSFTEAGGATGFIHTSRKAMVDLSGTVLNSGYPFVGRKYYAQEGSLIIWLGMNPLGLSEGYNDGTAIIVP